MKQYIGKVDYIKELPQNMTVKQWIQMHKISDNLIIGKQENTMICGLCSHYDSDMGFCEKHLNWGELVEMDSCPDYEELP